jgi:periplasmic protein TonB
LQNQELRDPRPSEKLPPLPAPQLKATKIKVLSPELDVPRDPDPSQDVMGNAGPEISPPSSPSTPQPRVVRQVPGGPGAGFPSSDDFYPAQAKRMEEQGIATVRVCVDTNGRLTSDPATVQTSGSSRLDQGAMQLARVGSGHYRPTFEDGRPVNSCYSFRVRFELKN